MIAYHFLRADMTAGSGNEPPWTVGEERSFAGEPVLCQRGYHSSPSWFDAVHYAPGPVACVVEVSEPIGKDASKQVSKTRTLLAARNVERELRQFACGCAERALLRDRKRGREPDSRSWRAIEVSRLFAAGKATDEELDAAWYAARDAAWYAAWYAAGAAARDGAWYAAWYAAGAAAWDAEIAWQREHLAGMLDPLFADSLHGKEGLQA